MCGVITADASVKDWMVPVLICNPNDLLYGRLVKEDIVLIYRIILKIT